MGEDREPPNASNSAPPALDPGRALPNPHPMAPNPLPARPVDEGTAVLRPFAPGEAPPAVRGPAPAFPAEGVLARQIEPRRAAPLEVGLLLSRRPACRLVLGHRERQAAIAADGEEGDNTVALLRLHLRAEVPELRFWRYGDSSPEIVWLCAFERGAEELVARLRLEHPTAFLMVSARRLDSASAQELKALGADAVYSLGDLGGRRLRDRLLAGLAHKRAGLKA